MNDAGHGSAGTVTVKGSASLGYRIEFGGDYAGIDLSALTVNLTGAATGETATLTKVTAGQTIAATTLSSDADADKVLDLSNSRAVTVATGPGQTQVLRVDPALGDFSEFSLTADLAISDYLSVSGTFKAKANSATATIQPATGDAVPDTSVREFWLAGNDLAAFVGTGSGADRTGLVISDLDFAALNTTEVLADGITAIPREWLSLAGTIGSASLVTDSAVTLSADNLALTITDSATDNSLRDFADAPVNYSGVTLGHSADVGELFRIAGTMTVAVDGFVQASGSMAVEAYRGQATLNDDPASTIDVDYLTVGGTGLDATIGNDSGTHFA